jgi:hypothetical protein
MGLLELPSELLDRILYLSLPLSIEAFARACKAIYACAADPIKRLNTLKEKVAAHNQSWLAAAHIERDLS